MNFTLILACTTLLMKYKKTGLTNRESASKLLMDGLIRGRSSGMKF